MWLSDSVFDSGEISSSSPSSSLVQSLRPKEDSDQQSVLVSLADPLLVCDPSADGFFDLVDEDFFSSSRHGLR